MDFLYPVRDDQELVIGSLEAPRGVFRLDGYQAIESYEKVTTTGTSDVVDPAKSVSMITSGGAHTVALADGTYTGQVKKIVITSVAAGTITITPANFSDGTSMTMAEILDSVELIWDGSDWNIAQASGVAIV
jgi:hypothetical protein